MKNIITIIVCAILSAIITFGTSYFTNIDEQFFAMLGSVEKTKIGQEIISYNNEPITYHKIFDKGELIGIVTDLNWLKTEIDTIYEREYSDVYKDTSMTFGEDIYVTTEQVYYTVENIDDKILTYLRNNRGLGIYTNVIDFSTNDGVYATIYVDDIDDFYNARDKFLENFISSQELNNLSNGKLPDELNEVGTQSIGFRVQENITTHIGVTHPSKIMLAESEVLDYLCFGDKEERKYYTVQQGETLQGVGFANGDLSPKQIMMLNPDKVFSTDQILEAGMILNVTYFESPITVVVTKERLAVEDVYPDTPLYVEDESVYEGSSTILQEEIPGSAYVLYEEVWQNGVLTRGEKKSSSVVIQPVQGVIKVGTKAKPNVGSGVFRWPIDNVSITCLWGCYRGHQAIDLQNMYNRYDDCYAADNGTVIKKSYDPISGYYIVVDHNNGFRTYYGHFNKPAYVEVGDTVLKGEAVGQIGMTGLATGPHVHFEIHVDGVKHDPCEFMNCYSVVVY